MGDYYYKEIPVEEAYKLCCFRLKNKFMTTDEELRKWISDDISKMMPLETPQWRYYWFDDF